MIAPVLSLLRRWSLLPLAIFGCLTPLLLAGSLAADAWRLATPDYLAALPTSAVSQVVHQVAALWAVTLGFTVSHAITVLQRASLSWTVPNLRAGIRRDLLLLTAVVPVALVVWSGRRADEGLIARAALLAVWWFALSASWSHLSMRLTTRWWPALVPVTLVGALAAAPAAYVSVMQALRLPGALLLAAGGVWLLRWITSDELHRGVWHWTPRLGPTETPEALRVLPSAPRPAMSRGRAWWWFRLLAEEYEGRRWPRAWRLPPTILTQAASGLFLALLMYVGGTAPFLFLVGGWQGSLAARHQVTYPLSRRDRATVQYLDHLLTAVALFAAGSLMFWGLAQAGVPRYWAEEVPSGLAARPLPVTMAAYFALFPLVQITQAFAPIVSGPYDLARGFPRQMMLAFPLMLVAGLGAALLVRGALHITGDSVVWSLACCAVVAVVVQVGQYTALQAIFARRDLVARPLSLP